MPDKTTGGDRVWTLPGGQKRSVAAKKISADGQSAFSVRRATLDFKRVGNNLFIAVEPHYLFTMDGTVASKAKTRASSQPSGAGNTESRYSPQLPILGLGDGEEPKGNLPPHRSGPHRRFAYSCFGPARRWYRIRRSADRNVFDHDNKELDIAVPRRIRRRRNGGRR